MPGADSLKFTVRDVVGVAEVAGEFPTGTAVIVSGDNAAGKSSLLLGLGMCLAAEANPLGLNKTQQLHYAHNGSDLASASLQIGEVVDVEYSLRGGLVTRRSLGGQVSELALRAAAGFEDPSRWGKTEWKKLFAGVKLEWEVFSAAIMRDFDAPALTGDPKTDGGNPYLLLAKDVFKNVTDAGLDSTVAHYEEAARNSKRRWCDEVSQWGTAENYGESKAANWIPPGFLPEERKLSSEQLAAEVQQAREQLDGAKADGIVTQERVLAAREAAGAVPLLNERMGKLGEEWKAQKAKVANLKEQLNHANEHAAALRAKKQAEETSLREFLAAFDMSVDERSVMKCPCCDARLRLVGDRLAVAEKPPERTKDDLAKEQRFNDRIEQLNGEIRGANQQVGAARTELAAAEDLLGRINTDGGKVKAELQAAEKEARFLTDNGFALEGELTLPDRSAAISKAEVALKEAVDRQKRAESHRKAQHHHLAVQKNRKVIISLQKGNVSKEVERLGMERFLQYVGWVGKDLGYRVEVDGGVAVLNGRPARLCSESEQWAVRLVLTVALAVFFGVPLVCVDRLDVLDVENIARILDWLDGFGGYDVGLTLVVSGTARGDGFGMNDAAVQIRDGRRVHETAAAEPTRQ